MHPKQQGIHALSLNLLSMLRSLYKPIVIESMPL